MTGVVIDASALLALLKAEAGAEAVRSRVTRATISAVNYAEVISSLVDGGMPSAAAAEAVATTGVEVSSIDGVLGLEIGELRAQTQSAGLSLGDRACLALARARGLPALTADRAWAALDVGVEIVLIR
jgi:PIN domain nuclease of toxin-antitoxin system